MQMSSLLPQVAEVFPFPNIACRGSSLGSSHLLLGLWVFAQCRDDVATSRSLRRVANPMLDSCPQLRLPWCFLHRVLTLAQWCTAGASKAGRACRSREKAQPWPGSGRGHRGAAQQAKLQPCCRGRAQGHSGEAVCPGPGTRCSRYAFHLLHTVSRQAEACAA